MAKIICVNSFRRGAGRSNLTANLAALLARSGRRVGVVDANLHTPGLHVLFGLPEDELSLTFNDYLWGRCDIQQAAYNVTPRLNCPEAGCLWLVPASPGIGAITRVLRETYDVDRLESGCRQLGQALGLDLLVIDTAHGLNQESLMVVAIAETLLLVLRTDHQDYRGTGLAVQVAQRLSVPKILLLANETPAVFDFADVKTRLEQTYDCEVIAVLPHVQEMMALASRELFVLRYPAHPLTESLQHIVNKVSG